MLGDKEILVSRTNKHLKYLLKAIILKILTWCEIVKFKSQESEYSIFNVFDHI